MTTVVTSVSRFIVPGLVALSAALAAANWYLVPGRSRSWAAALAVLAVMGVALWMGRRDASTVAAQRAADSLRGGVFVGAIILVMSLGVKLAEALGAVDHSDASQRLTMVIMGVFIMVTGNAIPKTLTPLSDFPGDIARAQALQRVVGWALVLSGLAFAITWLVLPRDIATPVSVAVVLVAVIAAMLMAVQLPRGPRSSSAGPGSQ